VKLEIYFHLITLGEQVEVYMAQHTRGLLDVACEEPGDVCTS